MDIEKHILERIRAAIPGLKAVYLYGSRATGKHRPDSDFDVAVLSEKPLRDADQFFNLQIELAALTDAGVNLVDFRALPTVLQFEVLRTQKRLFCADRLYCVVFEAGIFSEYQRFNEERKPVVEAFVNRRLAHA